MEVLSAVLAASITWSLVDLSGQIHHNQLPATGRANVLVFLAPGCMVSERSRPTLSGLHAAYQHEGFLFFGVVPGRWPRTAVDSLQQPGFPILLDPDLKLTRQTGTRVTPEALVIDKRGLIVYRGRAIVAPAGPRRIADERLVAREPVRRTGAGSNDPLQ